jgi:hypothetical protein
LPDDTGERIRQWVKGEEKQERGRKSWWAGNPHYLRYKAFASAAHEPWPHATLNIRL